MIPNKQATRSLKRCAITGLITVSIGLITSSAQTRSQASRFPDALLCQMEQIVTTGIDSAGKIVSAIDKNTGEMVFSRLNSDSPTAGANFGSAALKILKRTATALWMAEYANDNVNLITVRRYRDRDVHEARGHWTRTVWIRGNRKVQTAALKS